MSFRGAPLLSFRGGAEEPHGHRTGEGRAHARHAAPRAYHDAAPVTRSTTRMAKSRRTFVCDACGAEHAQWSGRCDVCGEWNTIGQLNLGPAAPRAANPEVTAVRLAEIPDDSARRLTTGMAEFDRVLGGGLVPGAVVLIGGDPGVGKSTLALRAAADMARTDAPCLYVGAEESPTQIRMRAQRLSVADRELHIYPETGVDGALAEARRLRAGLIVVDSIQTVRTDSLDSAPGTVSQVRETALRLLHFAKASGTPVFLVGHVTKEGTVAGPRTLEHMVDTVLYLEGDEFHSHRLLRSVKNRFGPTFEVAVFEMRADGLHEVSNPSAMFLAERDAAAPGSSVAVPMEGTRPLLVEIQALVAPTAYSLPRRLATGYDLNRLNMLLAVLGRRAGISLSAHDVYLNVVGGLRIREPAVDLPVALAIASSHRGIAPDPDVAAVGELGLSGELRSVPSIGQRVREAHRLGFDRCLVPAGGRSGNGVDGIIEAADIRQALDAALP